MAPAPSLAPAHVLLALGKIFEVSVFSLTLLQSMGQRQLLPQGGHLADALLLASLLGDVGSEGCDGFPGPRGAGGEWVFFLCVTSPLRGGTFPFWESGTIHHWKDGSEREGLGFAGHCHHFVVRSYKILPFFFFFPPESWT